ncbi:hypothetical protein DB757_23725, partial [Xanthomonas perforans]
MVGTACLVILDRQSPHGDCSRFVGGPDARLASKPHIVPQSILQELGVSPLFLVVRGEFAAKLVQQTAIVL